MANSPEYGITQIDGKPATAVRYERAEKDGEQTYNLSFMMDNKTAMRIKGLDAAELEQAVGEKNAKAIQHAEPVKGSLKGSALSNEYGISPEAAAEKNVISNESERLQTIDRDEIVKRAAQVRENERIQREAAGLGQQAESKRIKVENLSEKAHEQNDANRLADRVGAPTNESAQISTEREKNRQIEMMDRVHQQFRVSGSKFHFKDQPNRIAFNDKGQRLVSASNDERVAQAMATMADAKGWKTIRVSGHPDFQREVWLESNLRGLEVRGYKPNEQDIKDLDARRERLSKNVVEREPEAEKQKKAERNKSGQEKGRDAEQGRSSTPLASAAVVGAGVAVGAAAAKAQEALRGLSGRVLEHGTAPYNHDPAEKQNYYVKLATDKGEQTVWGVDLKRAMAERGAKKGDEVTLEFRGKQAVTVNAVERDENGKVIGTKEIETNRNTWDVQKSDKHKVVEAVAAKAINERFKDPAQREAAMQAVNQRLGERAQAGNIPTVAMYDKKAPSKTAETERARPVVERNAERTR